MLLLSDGTVVYSASDLTVAASCEFGLLRRLDAKLGRIPPLELPDDAMRERAARLGDRYEAEVLAEMRARFGPWDPATGRGVAEITRPPRAGYADRATLAAKHAETVAVLRTGADVVYQAGFFDGRFSGWADFVIRDGPRYAVHDTKLARRAKVSALLQLAAYADQLIASGIEITEHVSLILGDRTVTAHRIDDLLPVYRQRRARLQGIIDEHAAETGSVAWGDERYRACGRCEVCAPEVEARRDVLLVAGLRSAQRPRLHAAGITTIDELAVSDAEVAGIAAGTLAVLRAQARLQVAQDPPAGIPPALPEGTASSGGVFYQLFAPDAVGQLPAPDPGDMFFDFEGDPLWSDEAGWGLEYLFGVVEAPAGPGAEPVFRAFWAHDRAQERQALMEFLAYVERRRADHPGMHIYHYAAYEKTALLRLAGRYGVGEEQVDSLLRDGVLVDLYAAVRACLRVGQRSYSLKKLEPLYMDVERSGDVQTAGESVIEYAEACAVRDAGRLAEWEARLARIADYNAYDCTSTLRLRDWLVARAAEVGVVPIGRRAIADGVEPPDVIAPERDQLAERLLAFANADGAGHRTPDQQAIAMLAAAIGYHWREAKPFWWAHFDRLVSEPAEWADRKSFLVERAEVSEPWHTPERARTPRRVLRLVGRLDPGSMLHAGARVCLLYDAPFPGCLATSADGRRGWTDKAELIAITGDEVRDVLVVSERLGTADTPHDALPMAVAPGLPPRTERIAAAIRLVSETVLAGLEGGAGLPDHPALDLLRRRPPRTRTGALHAVDGVEYGAAILAATADLNGSYLAVQGPPGTGKTYLGARVIAALVGRGWKVGVVAQSHAVVENLLREVAVAGVPADRIGKRPQDALDDVPWQWLPNDRASAEFLAAPGGRVIGGTTWDFTHPARVPKPVDLLVVDEAGQYSLADTIAVSGAAADLLLLGDPQQLPQVTQGQHPAPVDRSALGWLTDGHDTLPENLGFFLAGSWRMHPALCAAVSRLSYEGRLTSVDAAAQRSLEGIAPGVSSVLLSHQGNAVASVEEADEVVAQVGAVLGRRWRDEHGLRPLRQDDVLVVAAYNAQVWTIRRTLAAAGLSDVRVGTVDKYQGQQAVVVIVSLAASSADDVPRGMEFLLNRNRVNVAVSRAQWRAVIVRSDALTDYLPQAPGGLAELGAFLGLGP
jgi:uncharacterized protein